MLQSKSFWHDRQKKLQGRIRAMYSKPDRYPQTRAHSGANTLDDTSAKMVPSIWKLCSDCGKMNPLKGMCHSNTWLGKQMEWKKEANTQGTTRWRRKTPQLRGSKWPAHRCHMLEKCKVTGIWTRDLLHSKWAPYPLDHQTHLGNINLLNKDISPKI